MPVKPPLKMAAMARNKSNAYTIIENVLRLDINLLFKYLNVK